MIGRKAPPRIRTRLSAVTNSFVQAILPGRSPTEQEYSEALAQLGQRWDSRKCVYCGAPSTDFDHFRAIVKARRPSGFLNEAKNLVPACNICNSSKGSSYWRDWMVGKAKKAPAQRNIADLADRIALLDEFEKWGNHQQNALIDHVDADSWNRYWSKLDQIEQLMLQAQSEADGLRAQIDVGLRKLASR